MTQGHALQPYLSDDAIAGAGPGPAFVRCQAERRPLAVYKEIIGGTVMRAVRSQREVIRCMLAGLKTPG